MIKTFRQWLENKEEDKEDSVSALDTNLNIKPRHLVGMSVSFTGDVGSGDDNEKSQNLVIAIVDGFDDYENPKIAKLRVVNAPTHAVRTYFTNQDDDDKLNADPVSGIIEVPMKQFTDLIFSQPWWPALGGGAPPGMQGGDLLPGGPGL
jgi:hypothetical protein